MARFASLVALAAATVASAQDFNCSSQPDGAFSPVVLTNSKGSLVVEFIPYGGTITHIYYG